jgi:hypothetical protein
MSYLLYKFGAPSRTIVNSGTGGSGYNGQISSAVALNNGSVTLTNNEARINVANGISSPTHHTWQAHLVINRFWPVAGVDSSGVLCGNDGKLFSFASDTGYGYIHQEGTYPPLVESNVHNFTVELAGGDYQVEDAVQFYLGVNGAKPVRIYTNGDMGYEGRTYWAFNYDLKLGVDYFFQVMINVPWNMNNDYVIGNCAAGCGDTMVTGFPCGCTIYSWREDNSAINLTTGGNWAEDMKGVTPTPKPTPTPYNYAGVYEVLFD